MSKLNIDQKTIKDLFTDKKSDFLIPDYQRPYAWEEKECQTLWDDVFSFAFPGNNKDKFNDDEEYFLGPIVTFTNENGKMEVIDGQQRLTTLMLLLRAFYERMLSMQDEESCMTRDLLAQSIWKTNAFGKADTSKLKIDSEVATDDDKEEFLNILKNGKTEPKMKSKYALNYRFFEKKIEEFINSFASYLPYLPIRILNNCILLPIEAESQDTALRIFSTLNDRGKSLSDADIFKAQFYKYFSANGEKDKFIKEWKELEVMCERIFHPSQGTPMDEIFSRYMYYERALQGNKSTSTDALRKFYEKDNYTLLKSEETFSNLKDLARFWNDVTIQDDNRFSIDVLKRLFVLNYAPNGMWTYIVSVYYIKNRDANGLLENDTFISFLDKITAFIFAYALEHPGVNSLRTPVYPELINIVQGGNVSFSDFKFNENTLRSIINTYEFLNGRPVTKSFLTFWAFSNPNQKLLKLETPFEIEHIYAKSRTEIDKKSIESLGNKALLESRINIRASDYKFEDKKKYYNGYTNSKNVKKEASEIFELSELANNYSDFSKVEIDNRYKRIVDEFFNYLKANNLLEQSV